MPGGRPMTMRSLRRLTSTESYRGHYEALRGYNGSKRIIHGVSGDENYANSVMNNARVSYGIGQQ
jgi:hypothetical protein